MSRILFRDSTFQIANNSFLWYNSKKVSKSVINKHCFYRANIFCVSACNGFSTWFFISNIILSELYKFYLWLRCENIIDNDRNWPNVQIVIKLRKKLSVIWCYAGPTSLAPLPTRQSCNIRFRTFIIEFAGEIIVWDIVLQLTDHLPNDPQKNYI